MLEVRLLGPIEVMLDGAPVDIGAGRQRALLALLAVHAGEVVSTDRIIEELWPGEPPATAANAVQVYVSGLRKVLEPELGRAADARLLVTRRPGYVLATGEDQVDARRFEALAATGRRALTEGRASEAAEGLRQALGLWRGPALADLVDEPFARAEATRLEEHRLAALEDRVAADLAGDTRGSAELAAEIEGLVARHPMRERLWASLMLALYRSGRQADALRAYQRARQTLAEELGLEPGPELRRMEAAILAQAPELTPSEPERTGAPTSTPAGDRPRTTGAGLREERKVVTAFFADLAGSTALAERLDAEEFRLVVDDAVARMVAAVTELGGTIVSIAGDGLLSLFGAPVAHEDDPERAVRAGLRVVDVIADYADEVAQGWGVEGVAVRVGVNTGPAVLGPVAGGDVVDYTALGDAVNVAARLQAAARPGAVLVGAGTARLAHALFDWGEVHQLRLKGKADLVEAREALAVRTTTGPTRGVEGMAAELVGRDAEFTMASAALDAVLSGRGGVLIVTGEPGIGKSRLLRELRTRLDGSSSPGGPPRWLEGRCISYGETLQYGPIQAILRDWLGVAAEHPEMRVRVALRRAVTELFGTAEAEVLPGLAMLLGAAPDGNAPSLDPASPEAVQRAMVQAVRAVVERLSQDGPLVVAVEDLHWADADSLRLLEQLLAVTDDAAVLLVLTARPERDLPWWVVGELAQRQLAHRTVVLSLQALPADAEAALLAALAGTGTLPPEVERRLLDAAEGNPFFLEELLRSLIDAGALVRHDDGWRFDHDVELEIPETVEKVILARVDRLEPDAHAVLAAGAVLGREFALPVLEAVADGEVAVHDALRELQRLGLVRETRRWPTPEYRFGHALIQEAVYRSLLRDRRRPLHRAAAAVLEQQVAEGAEEHAVVLARHWEEAGELARAAAYHQQAADAARRLSAPAAAREHYSRALALADGLGWEPTDRRRVELLHGRAVAGFQVGDAVASYPDCQRALELARAGGHADLEGQLAYTLLDFTPPMGWDVTTVVPVIEEAIETTRRRGDVALEAGLLAKMGMHWSNQLRFDEGAAWTEEALRLARSTGDERVVAAALDGDKMVACHLGRVERLREVTEELEEILRRQGDLWYLQWALAEGAIVPMARARWDAALEQLDAACDLNRRIGDRGQASYLLAHVAWVHRARGDYGRAVAVGREAVKAADEVAHAWWLSWAAAVHGWTLLDLRAGSDAVAHLRRGLAAAERSGMRNYLLRCSGQLAWAHVLCGEREAAAVVLARTEQVFAAVRTPPATAFLHAAHGYVAAARAAAALGEPERGVGLLTPILEAGLAEDWKEVVAYASLVLGRCAGDRTLLEQALAVAGDAGLRGAVWEAHAALGHAREATETVRELAASIEEPELRDGFVAAATAEAGGPR